MIFNVFQHYRVLLIRKLATKTLVLHIVSHARDGEITQEQSIRYQRDLQMFFRCVPVFLHPLRFLFLASGICRKIANI
jgi:hypothetical protein